MKETSQSFIYYIPGSGRDEIFGNNFNKPNSIQEELRAG
jgi:hypothetical protein